MFQRIDIPPLPDDVCTVCGEPALRRENPVLTCSDCNVQVHLWCYDPKEAVDIFSRSLPTPSPWKCGLCAFNVVQPVCVMCGHGGGAMKATTDGQFVHGVCMLWIPDVEINDRERGDGVVLGSMSNDRVKLKCSLCRTRGACIQCYYKYCLTAFHPWCMLRAGMGAVSRRVIPREATQPDGPVRYLCYCDRHAALAGPPTLLGPSNPQQALAQYGHGRLPAQQDEGQNVEPRA